MEKSVEHRAEIEGRNGQSMTKQLLVLVKKHILPLKLNLAPFLQELDLLSCPEHVFFLNLWS